MGARSSGTQDGRGSKDGRHAAAKVAMYRHVYRAEPKELTQFGSVSGSEIQNLPFSHSGIISLYRSEPKEPT